MNIKYKSDFAIFAESEKILVINRLYKSTDTERIIYGDKYTYSNYKNNRNIYTREQIECVCKSILRRVKLEKYFNK